MCGKSAFQPRHFVQKIAKTAAWLTIPALAIVLVWLPVARHYYVPDVRISDLTVERARREPSESALRKLQGDRLMGHGWSNHQQVVTAAEELLRGELRLGDHSPVKFRLPFDAQNLSPSSLSLQLQVAGLVPIDLLLQAYKFTGQERFFLAARESILEFARYERSALLPRGLLWNDHAIANRVFVLSDFWRVYRRRGDLQPEAARAILGLVARSGELLAKREQFTFATNHGVMQNVALLRLRLGFPGLPNTERYQRLALERLGEQMAFYVNEEGVVLEHSAQYQFFGIRLLELVFRYIRLLELPVPEEWERKYAKALQVASNLQRPDGSLPLFGDTSLGARPSTPSEERRSRPFGVVTKGGRATRPDPPIAWYPVAGYAIWWDGLEHWQDSRRLRQTVVAFSLFPGHAHKHADDLSVLLWAGGQTWWTNLGYWPYAHRNRSQAESWNGSNAPHLIGESRDSERSVRPLSYGSFDRAVMLDVVREGPGGYSARRQVIHVKPNVWLILDSFSGSPKLRSMTRWTTGYGIILRQGEIQGSYLLEAQNGPARLLAFFFGASGLSPRTLPRAVGPFVGSSLGRDRELTASAVEVEERADDSWAAVLWVYDQDGTLALPSAFRPTMTLWRGPQDWTAIMPRGSTVAEVSRRGERFFVRVEEGGLVETTLIALSSTLQRDELHQAFLSTARKYPQFRDRLRYRQWGTYLLVAVAGVQELSLLILARRVNRIYGWLRLLSLALWIMGGIWIATTLRL